MAATITTSTYDSATGAFNQRKLDRCQDGTLWFMGRYTGTGVFTPMYSKDNGATWTAAAGSDVTTDADPKFSFFIDVDDYAHLVWKQVGTAGGARTSGYLYYMRGTPNAGRTAWTWSAAVLLTNLGSSNYDYPDVVAFRDPANAGAWIARVVCSHVNSTTNYAMTARLNIASNGTVTVAAPEGTRFFSGTSDNFGQLGGSYGVAAHTYPSIDFNHTGDGKTVAGGTPHLYVGWTAGRAGIAYGVLFRKAVYSGGTWTLNPERQLDDSRYALPNRWMTTHFDGTRVSLVGCLDPNSDVVIYDRDAADTTTTTTVLLASTAGADRLNMGSATYDSNGNVYLFGQDLTGANGTRKLNVRKWTRVGATLGPIVTFDSSGSDAPYISAARGGYKGAIELVYTDGTASPYNVVYHSVEAPQILTPYVPAVML